jgi:signal transduction histidine kinase
MNKKGIQLVRHLSPQLPLVWGDPRHLLQVFVNLINNAVDVLEEKGGGTIQVGTTQDQTFVVIEVADSGPGLAEPEKVFDPAASAASGVSVGLSACHRIVREHDGRISCRNRAEGGACFTILLPAGEMTAAAASSAPARA